MSPSFVLAFVETCMNEGLSKEATAELLQRQSVIHAAEQSPAFAEGYEKVASLVPGGLRPIARPGYFEKSAAPVAATGGKLILKSLGNIVRGAGQMLGTGAATTKGRALDIAKLVRNNPLAAAATSGLAGAGTIYGVDRMLNEPSAGASEVPYISPGGYDAGEAAASYDKRLEQYSRGISDLNKKQDNATSRMRELEKAVAKNDAGSGLAMRELQQLRRQTASTEETRNRYLRDLDSSVSKSDAMLSDIAERQKSLEAAKTSWAPHRLVQRAWYGVTGRNANDVYDSRIADLQDQAAKAKGDRQLAADTRTRLNNQYIGSGEKPRIMSENEMQDKFFPTYR